MIFLSERDVGERLTMDSAIKAVEGSFRRQSQGLLRHVPRTQLHTPAGYFAAVCVADEGLGIATVKSYTVIDGELRGFVVGVSSTRDGAHRAVIEADLLTKIRTGAASGVAAKFLARPGVTTAGIIGCGRQAPFQLDAVRRALPDLQVKAWTRRPEQLEAFCAATGAQLAASAEEAAACDVVLTATTSTTPVVRGRMAHAGCRGDRHRRRRSR